MENPSFLRWHTGCYPVGMSTAGLERVGRGALSAALALVLGAACVVSPQPLPPNHDPPVIPIIDITQISISDDGLGNVTITGAPGAVTGESTLSSRGPSDPADVATADVGEDGSFELTAPSDPANLYRIEAELDGELSDPLDLSLVDAADGAGLVMRADPPLGGCLTVDPSLVFDAESTPIGGTSSFAVEATNGCDIDVDLTPLSLAFADRGFVLDEVAPVSIPAGSVRALSLHFTPTSSGAKEDLLVIGVTDPAQQGFLLVTLRGKGF